MNGSYCPTCGRDVPEQPGQRCILGHLTIPLARIVARVQPPIWCGDCNRVTSSTAVYTEYGLRDVCARCYYSAPVQEAMV